MQLFSYVRIATAAVAADSVASLLATRCMSILSTSCVASLVLFAAGSSENLLSDAFVVDSFPCTRPSSGPQQLGGGAPAQPHMSAKQRKQQQEQELAAKKLQQQATLPGVSTRGLAEAGFGTQAQVIDNETAKQDQYLDQISQGLDQLKKGALVSGC